MRYRFFALAVFLIFSNKWLIDCYANLWQPKPRDIASDKPYSCGIVLGGFGSSDELGTGYFNTASDRFIQAVKLYKLGKIKHLIICGGNGRSIVAGFREAAWAKEEMKAIGIPDSVVICEDRSSSTAENAVDARKIIDSTLWRPPYLLITSAHHIPRASLLFKRAGIKTIAFPCNYEAGRTGFNLLGIIPRSGILTKWNLYLKELVGYYFN